MEAEHHEELEQLNQLYKENNELYHNIAVKLGMSDSAFSILYAICELGDGCLQKDVCTASGLSKQTVNTSVHKLEQAGYVELRVEHGRGTHLHLTEAGRALVAERIRPVAGAEEAAFAAMAPGECEELLRLTRVYLEHLRGLVDALPYPERG